jgi:hypothetical protein
MVLTYKEQYNKRYKFPKGTSHNIDDISKTTKIKKSILQDVYNRGTGAWKNNKASIRNIKGVKGGAGKKMSKEQWSISRIYSFVMGGKTQKTTDKDLWEKHIKSKK